MLMESKPPCSSEPAYLISVKWLRIWKEYVGFDEVNSNQLPSNENQVLSKLGAKFNEDIIEAQCDGNQKSYYPIPDHTSPGYTVLKKDLVEEKDYIVVSRNVMDFFSRNYEGYIITRPWRITEAGPSKGI